jgi:hypothetical protein
MVMVMVTCGVLHRVLVGLQEGEGQAVVRTRDRFAVVEIVEEADQNLVEVGSKVFDPLVRKNCQNCQLLH